MNPMRMWIMTVFALAAHADEGLYGVWKGTSLDAETQAEATITLSLQESDIFELNVVENMPPEDAALFWNDFDVEGPHFEILAMTIHGAFYVQQDSLLLEIYEFYMHLESGDDSVELFDVLSQIMQELMVTEALAGGESGDSLELIKDMIPPMIGLLRLSIIESLSDELSGPYTLDGDTLHLGAPWEEDTLTLYRQDTAPTAVIPIGWGRLKLKRRSVSK